jgi:hypothetical protein
MGSRIAGGLLLLAAICGHAGASDVPRHLSIARELVANLKPADNRYVLGGRFISMPGDPGANGYAMRADCSGFLLAIFERAQYPVQAQMEFLPGSRKRKRPAAEDFVHSIEQEKGFERVRGVQEMKPGDLLAHAMLDKADQSQTQTTGHVFLLDGAPRAIAPKAPLVNGTRQFEVSIIDSNSEHVGSDDSRRADPSNKIAGLGRGTIRLYAGAGGELVGWARTFPNVKRFFSYSPDFPSDTKRRKAAVGRPVAGAR